MFVNLGDDYASSVIVTFAGKFRPTSDTRSQLIGIWAATYAPNMSKTDAIALFATEGLFVENKAEYWLPIQTPLIPYMKRELTEGKPATLLIAWMGASMRDSQLDRVYVVNEFKALP